METRNTFNLNFFLKKHRANSTGQAPIYLRITINKKRTDMSLHRYIDIKKWNNSGNCASGMSKSAKELNDYIQSVRSTMYERYKYLRETDKNLSPTIIKNAYLGIDADKGKKIIELFNEHNKKIKKLIGIDFSSETIQRYETSLKHTQNFIKEKYKIDDIYLTDINHEFITDYEIYFKTVRRCSHNTTIKYIKNFRKIVLLAIANGYLKKDPFVNYKMRLKKVDRGFLSDEELNILINKKFHSTRLDQVRDCFVFSCFTGLAHSDLKRLTPDNIVIGTDGGQWIKIKRKKTDGQSSIPMLPVTKGLIEKYKNNPSCIDNNVLLPVLSNQKMNEYLKEIADVCGIKHRMSSHLARHTFATTVTLNNDVPIESVSKMLGHSSITMTRTYARLLDKKVSNDMSKLHSIYR